MRSTDVSPASIRRLDGGWSVATIPFLEQMVGPVRPALLMLLAAAGGVLLIGISNLANLFPSGARARA